MSSLTKDPTYISQNIHHLIFIPESSVLLNVVNVVMELYFIFFFYITVTYIHILKVNNNVNEWAQDQRGKKLSLSTLYSSEQEPQNTGDLS